MYHNVQINMVAAIGERNRVIGRNNDLPWSTRLKPDMQRFKEITTGGVVIMGRMTWESIPEKYRPLPDRQNIVVSRSHRAQFNGAWHAVSIEDALFKAIEISEGTPIHIVGGEALYAAGMQYADVLYLTLVDEDAEGDRYFPEYPEFRGVECEFQQDFAPRLTYQKLVRQ